MAAAAWWVGGAVLSATTATIDSFDMTSGANDIVVVRHDNGDLQSSPFNVRFGKAKVIRRSDKYVYVEVNGKRVQGVVLKLGPSGEAFWVTPATRDVPQEARCSPITSPRSPPNISPNGSAGSSPQSTGLASGVLVESADFELGRGVATDAVDGAPAPAAATKKPKSPVAAEAAAAAATAAAAKEAESGDFTEGELLDEDNLMMDDDEADALLAQKSEVLKRLNERLHNDTDNPLKSGHTEGDESFYSACSPIGSAEQHSQAIPVEGVQTEELRLARSAEAEKDRDEGGSAFDRAMQTQAAQQQQEEEDVACSSRLAVWRKVHDREKGTDVYWNMRTNECTHERPADYVSAAGEDEGPALSSDDEDENRDYDDAEICAKTLYPTKQQLAKLGLQDGENEITFVVYTTLRGKQSVTCYAYLWDANTQLVVSDVDGTITRSDVLGHILPKVGKDWTHKGICSLYQRLSKNGYKIVYLSSRSISQIVSTREYIYGVEQDSMRLPRGPLLVAPDRIFAAFTREVVKRTPHEFKCRMLHTVKMAYPEYAEPFYAGFGNRINDAWAYSSVGIKEHKVFLIDPNSLIHVFDRRVKFRAYCSLDELCDQAFPPLNEKKKTVPTEYNSFNYWCLSPGMGVDDDLDPNDLDTAVNYTVPKPNASTAGAGDAAGGDAAAAETAAAAAASANATGKSSKPGLAAAWGSPPSIPKLPENMVENALNSPPRSPVQTNTGPTLASAMEKAAPAQAPAASPPAADGEGTAAAAAAASPAAGAADAGNNGASSEPSSAEKPAGGGWGLTSIFGMGGGKTPSVSSGGEPAQAGVASPTPAAEVEADAEADEEEPVCAEENV